MKDLIRSISKAASVRNFINLSLNQGINVIVAVIATPLLYTRLGEGNYGLVNLALTIVLLSSMLVGYGFNINGPKRLALLVNNPAEQSRLINEVIITRLLLSLVSIVALFVAVTFLNLFQGYKSILVFSSIILLAEAVFPMFILQGLDRLYPIALSNFITKVAYLLGLWIVVKSPEDTRWVNFLLGSIMLTTNSFLLVRIYVLNKLSFYLVTVKRVWQRIKENFQFFSYTFAAYVMVNGGFILLGNFVSDIELGRYSLAHRVAILLRSIPAFIAQSILQNASRLYDNDEKELEAYLKKTIRNGLYITFAIGLVFAIGAPWLIYILSQEYIPFSARVLQILSFLPFLATLNLNNTIRIIVMEEKSVLSRAIWLSTFSMIIISTFGCVLFGGYGLAVAAVISEFLNFIIHRVMLKRTLNQRLSKKHLK
ncbi:oligosaccharide flippase family protein [Roseivirga sp.]|uniref:oligosaccharide flippase family protein n=1 Tax=Roseivirga sp. TaxID=1964215 RepID=UPI003B8B3677